MLHFHVTNEIFELVKNGEKTHEYRNYNNYWFSRLNDICEPTDAVIVRGYTKDKIPIRINDISVILKDEIDNSFYKGFIKTRRCFDIEFILKED